MAKKPAARKATRKKTTTTSQAKPPHKENPIEHLEQVIEARFFEGAEQATDTTSAETNAVLAALAAIEGPHDSKSKAEGKPRDAKRKSPSVRPKKR
jgi:hypothetical protein